jgi:hypothetical protein
MELTKETIIGLPFLCEKCLEVFNGLDLPATFTARQAAQAYLANGGKVHDVARAYGAMVSTGLVADTGAIWRIARLAFAVQDEESGLQPWAETLGPDNWGDAYAAARAYAARTYTVACAYAVARAAEAAALNAAAAAYAACASDAAYASAAIKDQETRILGIIFQAVGE